MILTNIMITKMIAMVMGRMMLGMRLIMMIVMVMMMMIVMVMMMINSLDPLQIKLDCQSYSLQTVL